MAAAALVCRLVEQANLVRSTNRSPRTPSTATGTSSPARGVPRAAPRATGRRSPSWARTARHPATVRRTRCGPASRAPDTSRGAGGSRCSRGIGPVRQQFSREEALHEVVVAAVALPSGEPEDARHCQCFQDCPHLVGRSPEPLDGRPGLEVDRTQCALAPDALQDLVDERLVRDKCLRLVAGAVPVPGEAVPGQLVRGQQAEAFVVRLEEQAFVVEEGVGHFAPVVLDARCEHQVVVAARHLERIELHGPQPLERRQHALADRWAGIAGGARRWRRTRNSRAASRLMGRGVTRRDGRRRPRRDLSSTAMLRWGCKGPLRCCGSRRDPARRDHVPHMHILSERIRVRFARPPG